eukprot:UN33244
MLSINGAYRRRDHMLNGSIAYGRISKPGEHQNPGEQRVLWYWPKNKYWMISKSTQINTDYSYAYCKSSAIQPTNIKKKWVIFNKRSGQFVPNQQLSILNKPPPLPPSFELYTREEERRRSSDNKNNNNSVSEIIINPSKTK